MKRVSPPRRPGMPEFVLGMLGGLALPAVAVADGAALAANGDWFFFIQEKQLWRVPTAGGAAERLASLPGAGADTDVSPLAVAPAGQRVAYEASPREDEVHRTMLATDKGEILWPPPRPQ